MKVLDLKLARGPMTYTAPPAYPPSSEAGVEFTTMEQESKEQSARELKGDPLPELVIEIPSKVAWACATITAPALVLLRQLMKSVFTA
jgi:hypothetical protein